MEIEAATEVIVALFTACVGGTALGLLAALTKGRG